MKGFHLMLVAIILTGVAEAGPAERVKEIRKWYNEIQACEPSRTTTIKFALEDDPFGGEATIRDYPHGLKAIAVSYISGDHGGADEYFYYRNGELFFVFEVSKSWRFEGGTDIQPKSVDVWTENRFYFEGDACVRHLTREAKSANADKLKAIISKVDQKKVEPGEAAAEMRQRGVLLYRAGSGAEVLKAYAL